MVNHKRVERIYTEARLQVQRRKRKKVPVGERQPLVRPTAANAVWSMDFAFDRGADGRVIKCLTIVNAHLKLSTLALLSMRLAYLSCSISEIWVGTTT